MQKIRLFRAHKIIRGFHLDEKERALRRIKPCNERKWVRQRCVFVLFASLPPFHPVFLHSCVRFFSCCRLQHVYVCFPIAVFYIFFGRINPPASSSKSAESGIRSMPNYTFSICLCDGLSNVPRTDCCGTGRYTLSLNH